VTTKANILELNGRPYDAITGVLLADHPAKRAAQAVDGFITTAHHMPSSVSHTKKPPHINYRTIPSETETQPQHRVFDIHHRTTQSAHHHQPSRATTLMRHAVHRPTASLKRHTKVSAPTDILAKLPHFDVLPKHSISAIDQERLKRAERIAKSKLVSRFGNFMTRPITTAPIHETPATKVAPPPQAVPKQPSDDIFERALAHATSHQQPGVKHKRVGHHKSRLRRLTSIGAASLSVLLIVGFVAYQNVAQIKLHVADSKAGINAKLPSWSPSGFTVASVQAHPGSVAVNFAGNDKRSFSLIQTASKWNNSTLFNNYVFPVSNSYEAVQARGTTIYTYNNNDATWVSNGIWYKLITNGALSTSQLVSVAVSL
jgi:hypothetical protein